MQNKLNENLMKCSTREEYKEITRMANIFKFNEKIIIFHQSHRNEDCVVCPLKKGKKGRYKIEHEKYSENNNLSTFT